MNTAWAKLREHVDRTDVPQAHKELLDLRRQRVASGRAIIHDWDDVKDKIGQRGAHMSQAGIVES